MIGIDIVEVERVDDKLLKKIAHPSEINYVEKAAASNRKQKIAALWAVKEAVMKALGLGKESGVSFLDITLLHETSGRPYVELSGVAKQEMQINHYGKKIEVSISHEKDYAVAIAIIQ